MDRDMGKLSRTDPGIPGTARYRRIWELKGKTQGALAKLCKPPLSQPGINQFECAKSRLTCRQAKRMAPAYFPDLCNSGHAEKQHEAYLRIWQLWFESVKAYGSETLKREAEELSAHIGASMWELPRSGLFAPQMREIPEGMAEECAKLLQEVQPPQCLTA